GCERPGGRPGPEGERRIESFVGSLLHELGRAAGSREQAVADIDPDRPVHLAGFARGAAAREELAPGVGARWARARAREWADLDGLEIVGRGDGEVGRDDGEVD